MEGAKIFVVEDEALISMMIEDTLERIGFEVAGVAAKLADALSKARTMDFDAAILDVNLDGEKSFPVADVLAERGTPFVFASGYGRDILPSRYAGVPVLVKPFEPRAVGEALRGLRPGIQGRI